jgi:spoIIIJ-associated protein
MPNSIEAQGVTVEEAIQVALNQLGVTRDRVEIEIVHHPRSGFLGIGARRAKVRATVREVFLADGEEYDMTTGAKVGRGGRRGRRSRRRRGRRTDDRPDKDQTARPTETRDHRARDERSGDAGQDRRRGRQRQGREVGRPAEASGRAQGPADRSRRNPPQQQRQRADGVAAAAPAQRRPDWQPLAEQERPRSPAASATERSPIVARDSPSGTKETDATLPRARSERTVTTEEIGPRAQAAVAEILRRMGFQASVTSSYDPAESEVVLNVTADAEGLLIGRRGQTLDALEHLVNRIVLSGDSVSDARIVVDVGGYRERRRDTLLELADRLKVRALTQGRRIQVSPMSPRDRRILQEALGRDAALGTRVLGTGFYRRIVIFPAGIDEESIPLESEDDDEARGTQAAAEEDEES